MNKKIIPHIPFFLLTIWYSIIFWDPGRLTVGEAPDLISIYGLLMAFLVISLLGKIFRWVHTDYFTTLYLVAWGILQWQAHWQDFFMGAPKNQVAAYNSHFSGTYRIMEPSATQIIPDLYHTVMGVLLAISIVIALTGVIKMMREHLAGSRTTK